MKLVGFCLGLVAVCVGVVGAGVAAGCTSDHDTRVILPAEGGPRIDGGTVTPPGATCPSDIPVDARDLFWKPPAKPQEDKCQEDDVVAMKEFLAANPNATNTEFENFVKNRDTNCHDCVFGDADGPTWPPVPVKDGRVLTFNVGACYALTTGNEECGRAKQNVWDCEFDACVQCDSSSTLAACRPKSRTGVCSSFVATAQKACVGPSADEVCGAPFDSIRVQCVTTAVAVPDAGIMDAGTD